MTALIEGGRKINVLPILFEKLSTEWVETNRTRITGVQHPGSQHTHGHINSAALAFKCHRRLTDDPDSFYCPFADGRRWRVRVIRLLF
jgi:hypothetical protein